MAKHAFANPFLKTDEVTRLKGSDFEGLITTAFILSLFYLKQQNTNVSIAGFLSALLCYCLDMISGTRQQLHDHGDHGDHADHVDHEDHDHGDPSAPGKCCFLAVPALPISVTQNGPTFDTAPKDAICLISFWHPECC